MNERLINCLKEWRKVKDELLLIEKRLENVLTDVTGMHLPTDSKCFFSIEKELIRCRMEFPEYFGFFTLSGLLEIQKELGTSEIEVSISKNSSVCLVFNLPALLPF